MSVPPCQALDRAHNIGKNLLLVDGDLEELLHGMG